MGARVAEMKTSVDGLGGSMNAEGCKARMGAELGAGGGDGNG
jgi:hypothetical protein